ncbi:MAG: S8 family serine peptidase [Chloroflexota bacterium]
MRYRIFLLLLLIVGFSFGSVIRAQDAAPAEAPTEFPTDIPTEIPTDVPTDVPTDIPTDVVTDIPTDVPTEGATDVPTDVSTQQPIDSATEEATETPTLEPTVAVNLPPQFSLDGSSALDATAGLQTTFTLAVADEDGLVTIGRTDTTSVANVVVTQATEAVAADPRFYTAVTIDYTAPADFVGQDSFTLVAVDAANLSSTLTLTVNVALPESTVEATLEPTLEPTTIPDQVRIINYNPAASETSIQAMLKALGAVEVSRIPQIGAMKVQIPQAVSATASAASVLSTNTAAKAAGMTSIEPEIIYHIDAFPNDPYYPSGAGTTSNQWALDHASGSIFAANAWGISVKDGAGVTVAVIDTGIDTTHPDLVGKLLPGWDFVNDDNNTDDDNGHGTHVSGIIAANTNNGKGIAGVAFNAKLLPVKVCDFAGGCSTYDIAAGIVFATDKAAKVINMSLGGGTISTTIQGAVQYALSRNVTVVAAAGNCNDASNPCLGIAPGAYMYPASYDGVISVAAHDIDGNHADFSQSNDHVTVSAPGVSIVSTYPPELDNCDVPNDGYCTENGTSMAAPQVTGIVALMLSDNVVKSPAQAKEALICSAYDPTGTGKTNDYGYGWVQADWAQNWTNYNTPNSSDCKVSAPNDLYQNATNIAAVPFTTTQAVHSRSVTTSLSDPSGCFSPTQTLWYKFKPTISDYYQINTLGSSYDTELSVWQMPEEGYFSTNYLGCNDDYAPPATIGDPLNFNGASMLNVPLTAGQTYYIMVNSINVTDDEILDLDVRRSLASNNVDYQENSPNIFYSGSWVQGAATGASGGQVKTTSDLDAVAAFTFRGIAFDVARTIGPTQGLMEVWIDGQQVDYIYNRAAVLKRNQIYPIDLCSCSVDDTPGKWHQVVLRRSPYIAGPVDIDRIRTYEGDMLPTASITALTDDNLGSGYPCATKKFCYTDGSFLSQPVVGANLGKVTQTLDIGATISFRATGSAITIFRSTGPNYGSMDVQVDGVAYATVSNNSAAIHAKVPYVISGLGAYSHVVQIINNDNTPYLPVLQFDAAQASTPGAIAASTVMTNENAATLLYGGYWANLATPGTFGNTIRQASDAGSSVSFNYTGNWFMVGYRMTAIGSTVDVYEDNQFVGTISDPGGSAGVIPFPWQDLYLRSDRTHSVRLVVTSGTFELDSVGARRQIVITPSTGLIQETNAAIRYNTFFGAWTTTSVHSVGGAGFQGGTAKRATNAGANLTFYVNGTGFMLYTSQGPLQDGWDIYVDGSVTPYSLILDDISVNFIDLFSPYRFHPFAYAVTGLGAGIHTINLVKHSAAGSVDFDAVRAFP